jgi:4-amino-4-deoxy-L-arabinose transferase-like glycosyltransferase
MELVGERLRTRIASFLDFYWAKCGFWGHAIAYLTLMVPFSLFRHVRIHGDEKVYVGQALEMLRAGHFWQQLQFGDVNYIKGPTHYLLLILGHHLFGFSMLSVVYMNLLMAALAMTALRTAAEFLLPKGSQLKALPAWLFASAGAFVMFTFSSQMDSALTSLYAVAMSLAVLARLTNQNRYYFLLWMSVGLAGTLKSPIHSCLIGFSVLLYFVTSRSLQSSLFSSVTRIWFLVSGVIIGGVGYLVPFMLDRQNWLQTYIFREQIDRPRFSDSHAEFLFNNFLFHLIPWSFLLLSSILILAKRIRGGDFRWDELTKVSISFFAPTFLFFFGLGYLAPWYGLPLAAPLALFIVGQLQTNVAPFRMIARSILPWSALMIAVVVLCHTVFFGGTPWWTGATATFLILSFLMSLLCFKVVLDERVKIAPRAAVVLGVACFWIGALGLTATLGESELADVRELVKQHDAPLNYNNIDKENYSEWGIMAYMTGRPAYFSNSYSELLQSGLKGQWLVFTNKKDLNGFWSWLEQTDPGTRMRLRPSVHIWRRWPRNAVQMREIWESRESTENLWDKVSRHFFVVRFIEAKSQVSVEE